MTFGHEYILLSYNKLNEGDLQMEAKYICIQRLSFIALLSMGAEDIIKKLFRRLLLFLMREFVYALKL